MNIIIAPAAFKGSLSAVAVAEAIRRAPQMRRDQLLIVCLSGRGDKDMETYLNYFNY